MSSTLTKKSSARESLATIEAFLEEVGTHAKTAAEANTEAGSQGGETTHPVKNVDDNTDPAREGARSAENTADVKKDQGDPAVDATPEAKAKAAADAASASGSAASDQLQIGTVVKPTGEDPKNETASAKAGKTDPGTTHPAKVDNDALNGGKFASDVEGASFEKLASMMRDLGNDICALIAVESETPTAKTAAATPAPQPTKTAEAAVDPKLAEQAGWALGSQLGLDKKATDEMVVSLLVDMVKAAEDDADRVINYINAYTRQKQAAAARPRIKRAEGMPPEMMGGGGAPAGGDPAMAAGGPPAPGPGDGDGDDAGGGAGGLTEEDLAALAQQLGVSPEELMQILEQEAAGQGGGAGAPPPEAGGGLPPEAAAPPAAGGGMPPEAAGGMPPGMQVQAADSSLMKEKMASFIREIVGRSRAKKAAAK